MADNLFDSFTSNIAFVQGFEGIGHREINQCALYSTPSNIGKQDNSFWYWNILIKKACLYFYEPNDF